MKLRNNDEVFGNSIDAGFKEHPRISESGKKNVDKNRKILESFKEEFLTHGFTFDSTNDPYLLRIYSL